MVHDGDERRLHPICRGLNSGAAHAAGRVPVPCRRLLARPTSHAAWTLTVGVQSVASFEILAQLAINAWNVWFVDIPNGQRAGTIGQAAFVFVALAAVTIGAGVTGVLCGILPQVRWRAWLTGEMLDNWLSDCRFPRLVTSD